MKTHKHAGKLCTMLGLLYAVAVATYMRAERHSLGDAVWWGFMTFTTVGYGDQYPQSVAGRVAGIALVSTAIFVVVPVITASVIGMFADKTDAWTHDEQEEVKENLRILIDWVNRQQ